MCGLTGFITKSKRFLKIEIDQILSNMNATNIHRGPDSQGLWSDPNSGVWLGHQRLAVIDLTSVGHQPMKSASNRYVIIFNGEIYNHLYLRRAIETARKAPKWRGHSDTETLLAAFDAWGIKSTLKKVNGMFAFAVWDKQKAILNLARDRLGEKPLYYGWQGTDDNAVFLFSSELQALRKHPIFEPKIDRSSLSLQLRYNYIPSPYSIYEGIKKLPPGSLLEVSLKQRKPKVWKYWSGAEAAQSGSRNIFIGSNVKAIDLLEKLLKDAVNKQMTSDVPLGAFLSGGVDSSTIVALMQSQSKNPVKTFTIGFDDKDYNEAVYSKSVAKHLGTDHSELYVTPEQARNVIPNLADIYDEPFSDASQIPTFLLAQLARQHVKVALSGDGGDELFCGYNRYKITENLWKRIEILPIHMRKFLGLALTSVSPNKWNKLVSILSSVMSLSTRFTNLGEKLHKGAGVITSNSVDDLYLGLVSHWQNPEAVVINGDEPPTLLTQNIPTFSGLNDIQRMMALDMLTYLPDDILTKVDRAAMSVSLETRIPFLDHRVVEFAWTLPQSMKLREGQTKWILRQVLYRHIPRSLIERPKMGFEVPIANWLRGPLREWAESLLNESRLNQEGFFYSKPIRQKWAQHLSGQRNWQYHLWSILMFQAWLEKNK